MLKVTRAPEMDEASRAALASGRADPALGLFVETMLSLRGLTQAEGEIAAGASLEAEPPAPLPSDLFDRVMAAIERGAASQQPRPLAYAELEKLPAPLVDAIRKAEAARGWRVHGPGIRRLMLDADSACKLQIIRLDAGKSVPRHTHKGNELTLCIHGEYADGLEVYGPGDVSITDPSIRHQPRASSAGPAYALAIVDAGLKFEGLLGAIQRLTGQ